MEESRDRGLESTRDGSAVRAAVTERCTASVEIFFSPILTVNFNVTHFLPLSDAFFCFFANVLVGSIKRPHDVTQ